MINNFEYVGLFITSTIPWPTPTRALSLFYTTPPPRSHHLGLYLPKPVSVLGPATNLSPSLLLVQAIFEPNLFPYKYYNIFKPIHFLYLSTYEDETVFRNVGI
jgi:hypothetical protein